MGFDLKTLEILCPAAMGQGRAILEDGKGMRQLQRTFSDGKWLLQAKMIDSFCFVDHPRIEADPTSGQILSFRCDCPDFRANQQFCGHCAALALDMEQNASAYIQGASTQNPALTARFGEGTSRLADLSYAFANSNGGLYPGVADPKIPLEIYRQVFPGARAISEWEAQGQWGGNCFGMTTTACLLQQRNEDTTVADFKRGAKQPSELGLQDYNYQIDWTLLRFIELMQLTQFKYCVALRLHENRNSDHVMEDLAQTVERYQQGEGRPAVMAVIGPGGGHAVLPYYLEHRSKELDVLHIYDPNWPLETRYAYLQKDAQGNYCDWQFSLFEGETYSGKDDCELNFVEYDVFKQAWDERGEKTVENLLHVLPNVAIKDPRGTLLARVTANGVESYRQDIFQVHKLGGRQDGQVLLSVPADMTYTIAQQDPQGQLLKLRMVGQDLAVKLETEAREVSVHVEDAAGIARVRIDQGNAHYCVDMLNTLGKRDLRVQLEGTTQQEALVLMQRQGRLYGRGVERNASLRVNDMVVSAESIALLEEEQKQEQEMILNQASQADMQKEDT